LEGRDGRTIFWDFGVKREILSYERGCKTDKGTRELVANRLGFKEDRRNPAITTSRI